MPTYTPAEDAFFGKHIEYDGISYTVNQLEPNKFSIWKEDDAVPYLTTFKPVTCTCTDWKIRRRKTKSTCKHHRIANIYLNKEEETKNVSTEFDPYSLNS